MTDENLVEDYLYVNCDPEFHEYLDSFNNEEDGCSTYLSYYIEFLNKVEEKHKEKNLKISVPDEIYFTYIRPKTKEELEFEQELGLKRNRFEQYLKLRKEFGDM